VHSEATPNRTWPIAAAVVFGLCGLGMLGLSAVPVALALVGARLLGALALVCAALLLIAGRPIARGVSGLSASFTRVGSDLARSVRSGWRQDGRAHWLALIAIVLVGIGLRLSFLWQPMRFDESVTYLHFVSKPLYQGLSDYAAPNNHLFHTLLAHIATMLFGSAPWALRLPAFVAGVCVVPAAYGAFRALYNKHVGLITAGLVAASSALIEYSVMARGYTIQCVIVLLLVVLCVYLQRHREAAAWLAFAVLSALAFYTVPTSLLALGVLVVWMLLSAASGRVEVSRGRLIRDLAISAVLAAALTALLYTPVLLASGWRALVANKFVISRPWPEFVAKLPAAGGRMWAQWTRDVPLVVGVVLLVGFCASFYRSRRWRASGLLLVIAVPLWCVPMLALQRAIPYTRNWLFLIPFFLGFASAGLVVLLRALEGRCGRLAPLLYIVPALAACVGLGANVLRTQSVYYSTDTGAFRDAEAIVVFLKGYLHDDDRVLTCPPSGTCLRFYARREGMTAQYPIRRPSTRPRLLAVVDTSRGQTLDMVLERYRLSASAFGPPREIRRFGSAAVYELKRLPAAPDAGP
jgi:hypothetical protein